MILLETPTPTPDPTVQILTLTVAAIAAVAAVVAAVVTAVATSKRERSSWLRQEQMAAYEGFMAAFGNGLDEIAGGATQRAIDHPRFEGMDDAHDAVQAHTPRIIEANRRLIVVGAASVVDQAQQMVRIWVERSPHAVPLSGVAMGPADQQRGVFIAAFSAAQLRLGVLMRADLGLLSKKQLARATEGLPQVIVPPTTDFSDAPLGGARAILRGWRVRRWDGSDANDGEGYRNAVTPWAMMNVEHPALQQPLAAVLRKAPGRPWNLAIEDSLRWAQSELIERDAASIVSLFGRNYDTNYGGAQWIAGEVSGERIYWWALDDIPSVDA